MMMINIPSSGFWPGKIYCFTLALMLFSCGNLKKQTSSAEEDMKSTVLVTFIDQGGAGASVLKGRIADCEGNAMPFAAVQLNNSSKTYGAVSDENGEFQVKGIDLAEYRLKVNSSGYEETEEFLDMKKAGIYELKIKLSAQKYELEKPIIYLYPTEETAVSVKLNYKGTLTHTYPAYPEKGWQVRAEPDGTLWDAKGME